MVVYFFIINAWIEPNIWCMSMVITCYLCYLFFYVFLTFGCRFSSTCNLSCAYVSTAYNIITSTASAQQIFIFVSFSLSHTVPCILWLFFMLFNGFLKAFEHKRYNWITAIYQFCIYNAIVGAHCVSNCTYTNIIHRVL